MTINTKQKAAGAINTNGLHTDTNTAYFRTGNATGQAHDHKAIANPIARLVQARHHDIRGDIGDFSVCKYGLTRYCADFAELQAFVRQLGIHHG